MGVFKAAAGSLGGVMADQWLEIYSCDGMPEDVLACLGTKKVSGRSANTKGEENIISDGSLIIVNAGQCALMIEQGKIIDWCDTPGEHIYHSDRSKSIFHKGGLKGVAKQAFDRFGYGGIAGVHQFLVYLDIREHMSNAFLVTRAVNIKDRATGICFDARFTLGGMFSFRITKPDVFYQRICSNAAGTVYLRMILPQITAELDGALAVALAKVGAEGVSPVDISAETDRIIEAATAVIDEKWSQLRGFTVVSLSIDRSQVDQKDLHTLQELQRAKALTDPTLAAATLVGAQSEAMQSAAKNPSGNAGAVVVTSNALQPSDWLCSCGTENHGRFCENCGAKRPE